MKTDWPRIEFTEEALREGMQIESVDIPVADKIRLLDALSDTGLKRILVGSFVSPKYTPQMRDIEKIVEGFTPRPGVTYSALVLNQKGLERARAFCPPLTMEQPMPQLFAHLCDTFVRRNANRSQQDEIARWPETVRAAVQQGAREAGIGAGAAWGSNFEGGFTAQQRMDMLRCQHGLWSAAGVNVTQVTLSDPMSWNMPHVVEADVAAILREWPSVRRIYLHIHNARGMAVASIYGAMRAMDSRHVLQLDCGIGGIGGCPYCGNGRVARMAPTEDLVHMWEEMGIRTGVDLEKLVRAVWMAEEIVGHTLWGAVSKAGPFPRGKALYPADLPVVESEAEARHFMLGPDVIPPTALRPWKKDVAAE